MRSILYLFFTLIIVALFGSCSFSSWVSSRYIVQINEPTTNLVSNSFVIKGNMFYCYFSSSDYNYQYTNYSYELYDMYAEVLFKTNSNTNYSAQYVYFATNYKITGEPSNFTCYIAIPDISNLITPSDFYIKFHGSYKGTNYQFNQSGQPIQTYYDNNYYGEYYKVLYEEYGYFLFTLSNYTK